MMTRSNSTKQTKKNVIIFHSALKKKNGVIINVFSTYGYRPQNQQSTIIDFFYFIPYPQAHFGLLPNTPKQRKNFQNCTFFHF